MAKATAYSDQKNWSDTYLTDPKLIKLLGPFDMDPCCPPRMPWRTARRMYSHEPLRGQGKISAGLYNYDGLDKPWHDRVFMNPPYRVVMRWAKKFADHGSGIALLNGRSTETRATQIIMAGSRAIWFPSGRLTFYRVTGEPFDQKLFSSLLIGMQERDAVALERAAGKLGGVVWRRS